MSKSSDANEKTPILAATTSDPHPSLAEEQDDNVVRDPPPQQWTGSRRISQNIVPHFAWSRSTLTTSAAVTITDAATLPDAAIQSISNDQEYATAKTTSQNDASRTAEATNERTPIMPKPTPNNGALKCSSSSSTLSSRKLDGVYGDDVSEMTWGRRLARFLAQYSWYYPRQEGTNLDNAWAYFEHTTLARYITSPSGSNNTNNNNNDGKKPTDFAILFDDFPKADPGAKNSKTRLYPVLTLPESQLADFGVGVAVYFYTIRALAAIMLVAGLISIPNLVYFASSRYNGSHSGIRYLSLKASAICTDQTWVACPTCSRSQWDYFPRTYDRYAEGTSNQDGSIVTFILINNCNIHRMTGVVSSICLVYVCAAMYILFWRSKMKEDEFDRFSQTTRDYAIEVTNPPNNAYDPQEWRDYFQPFGHVTSVTVVVHNKQLVSQLIERRRLLANLTNLLPPGCDLMYDNNYQVAVDCARSVPWFMKLLGSQDAVAIQKKILELEETITTDSAKQKYHVSEVFVIMESEDDKERALEALSVPAIHFLVNRARQMLTHNASRSMFRGHHTLLVKEPPEPSCVRWLDLDLPLPTLLSQRLKSAVLTLVTIVVGCSLVIYARWYGTVAAAVMVTAVNTAAPMACRYITKMESHSSEGGVQSRYI